VYLLVFHAYINEVKFRTLLGARSLSLSLYIYIYIHTHIYDISRLTVNTAFVRKPDSTYVVSVQVSGHVTTTDESSRRGGGGLIQLQAL
jgi:hypothetical protein